MSHPRPEPEKYLLLHVKTFANCRTEIEAQLLLVRKLKEAGFRLNQAGEPEEDWERITSQSGTTMEFRQWPSGTIRAWEEAKMKRPNKMNGGEL